MKGIEGMALQYVVIILIAALVIGVVYPMISGFTGMVSEGGEGFKNISKTGIDKNLKAACENIAGCTWDPNTKCTCPP